MLRNVYRMTLGVSLFPFSFKTNDIVGETKTSKAFLEERNTMTGKERLYLMFTIDEYGRISPEMQSVITTACMGVFTGAIIGGAVTGRSALDNFIETNKATSFESHLDAKRRLSDKVMIGFGRGAFMWGWRLGMFSTVYGLVVTSVSTYRGKSGISEHILGGALSGCTYKTSLGLRAMLVGGIVGSVIGGIAGTLIFIISKIAGVTVEEIRFWNYQVMQERSEREALFHRRFEEEQAGPLFQNHDLFVGPKGKSLDALDGNKEETSEHKEETSEHIKK